MLYHPEDQNTAYVSPTIPHQICCISETVHASPFYGISNNYIILQKYILICILFPFDKSKHIAYTNCSQLVTDKSWVPEWEQVNFHLESFAPGVDFFILSFKSNTRQQSYCHSPSVRSIPSSSNIILLLSAASHNSNSKCFAPDS